VVVVIAPNIKVRCFVVGRSRVLTTTRPTNMTENCLHFPQSLQVNAEVGLHHDISFHILSNSSFTIILPFDANIINVVEKALLSNIVVAAVNYSKN
jgi:hypothetical protein